MREGEKVTKPQDPTKGDNVFKYWTLNDTDEFDFDTAITGDITLKAFWLPTVSDVGDTVTLGKESCKVLALDADKKQALLISEYLLGTYAYDSTLKSYEGSEIREYLQSDEFFKEYKLSKSYMKKVDVTSDIETTTISDSGEDYLFLLSKTEAENTDYFADDAARCRSLSWWLRTVAEQPYAYRVDTEGAVKADKNREDNNLYVRPAFWYSWN